VTPRSGRSKRQERPGPRPRRLAALPLAVLVVGLTACSGTGPQSSLEPQGPISRDIDGLWEFVLAAAVVVFVLVMTVYVISLIRFRERKNDTRRPRQVHGNTKLEIMWTIAPAVLLVVLTVPTLRGLFDIRTVPTGDDVLQVKVTGHQWWWEFEYPDLGAADGRTLITASELHIPAGRPVNLTMTSADVIHSFWVPPLNGKRDIVPGRLSNLTLIADADQATVDNGFGEGVILGQCAEFCGLAHADMRLRVFVHDEAGFQVWAEDQLAPAVVPTAEPSAAGFATFTQVCTACHQATVEQPDGTVETVGLEHFIESRGTRFRSSYAPNLTHFGSRTTLGGASLANVADHLRQWLANPSALKPMDPDRNDLANARILGMPNFGLSDEEIEGLVAMLEGWK